MTEGNKSAERGSYPALWRTDIVTLPGGFKPVGGNATDADNGALPTGAVIRQGTPLQVDFSARTAKLCKSAAVVSVDTTNKTITVKEGNLFVVGDKVTFANDTTGQGLKVTAIEATTSGEVLTVDATPTYHTADDTSNPKTFVKTEPVLVLSDNPRPNAIAAANLEYTGASGINCIDAACGATLLKGGIPWEPAASWMSGSRFADEPGIRIISQ